MLLNCSDTAMFILSYRGAAISVVVALSSAPVMAVVYVWARGLHKQTWGGWGWDSLRGWGQFAKLGIPGLLMTSIEWWSFEIAAFVTGSINKTELGINAVLINVISTAFAVSRSICCTQSGEIFTCIHYSRYH